jgi:hypothetical protein
MKQMTRKKFLNKLANGKSKRQKDLADIMRLVETHSHLYDLLPENIKTLLT